MMYAMSIITRSSGDIHIFHRIISEWIMEIHKDIRSDGYIIDTPSSLCGKKVRELRDHCMTKSAEISTIRIQTRRYRIQCGNILCRSLYFIVENLLPFILSIGSFSAIYWFLTKTEKTQYQDSTYLEQAGYSMGFILRSVVIFGSSVIDGTMGTDMFFTKINAFIIASAVAVLLYIGTVPCTAIIAHARTSSVKRKEMCILQEEFYLEYTRLIEQALYKHIIINLLDVFENILYITSESASESAKQSAIQIANTYYPNYELFYMYILNQLETHVREMDIIALIRSANVSSQFIHILFQLIRHSEDKYAHDLMIFNQALIDTPNNGKSAIIKRIRGLGIL